MSRGTTPPKFSIKRREVVTRDLAFCRKNPVDRMSVSTRPIGALAILSAVGVEIGRESLG